MKPTSPDSKVLKKVKHKAETKQHEAMSAEEATPWDHHLEREAKFEARLTAKYGPRPAKREPEPDPVALKSAQEKIYKNQHELVSKEEMGAWNRWRGSVEEARIWNARFDERLWSRRKDRLKRSGRWRRELGGSGEKLQRRETVA